MNIPNESEDDLSDMDQAFGAYLQRYGPNGVPIRYGFGATDDHGVFGREDDGYVHCSDILLTLKQTEYGAPWTQEKLANFMEALSAGWDAMKREQRRCPTDTARDQITELLQSGMSMVDVPAELGLPWPEVVKLINGGHSQVFWAAWGDMDWLRFETLIEGDGPHSPHDLAQEVDGASAKSMATLLSVYGKPIKVHRQQSLNAISQTLLSLMRDGITDRKVIQRELALEGHEVSLKSISDRLRRLRVGLRTNTLAA